MYDYIPYKQWTQQPRLKTLEHLWAVGAARIDLGSDAQGDLLYRGPSNDLVRLGIGVNGYVLTSNGTTPVWSALPASGEVNTGANLGGGLANYDSKSGASLRFNTFSASDFELAANVISIDATLKSNWNAAYNNQVISGSYTAGAITLNQQDGGTVVITGLPTGGDGGENNTASNLGGGLDNYSTKVGVDLRFNSFAASDFDLNSNVFTIDATLKANWNAAYNNQVTSGSYSAGTITLDQLDGGTITITGIPTGSGGTYTANNGLTMTSNNIQLGGNLVQNTTINQTSSNHTLTVQGNLGQAAFIGNGALELTLNTAGVALYTSINASINNGASAIFDMSIPDNNTVYETVFIRRSTSGTAANGIGTGIGFFVENSAGSLESSNSILTRFTTAIAGSAVSEFSILGKNVGAPQTIFTLSGNGAARLNKYGINTFAATPAYALGVDASGNLVEFAVPSGGGSITANNGLTMSTSTNVQWGGALVANTTIASSTFISTFTGANTSVSTGIIAISNSSTGVALSAVNNGNQPTVIFQNSGSGYAFSAVGTTGSAINAASTSGQAGRFRVSPSSTNTTVEIASFIRGTSGAAANNLGGFIGLYLESTTNDDRISNQLISRWIDATDATRTSKFIITGVYNATTQDLFTLNGNGSIQLRPITATVASAITPAEGMLIFASSTDATFTSIGLWCYENGAWSKK